MSEHIVRIIPKEVGTVISTGKEQVAAALKDMGIDYKRLEVQTLDEIKFMDCGKNLEYIRCPYCHKDALKWWGSVMSQAARTNFKNRNLVTPCCHRGVMLEDLDYCLDMGFARFVIEIHEPDTIITNGELYELGIELDCELKKISVRL